LGAPAVPEVGKPEVVGLVVTVPNLIKSVGELPNGETIAGVTRAIQVEQSHVAQELVDHREAVQEAITKDHNNLKGLLDQHAANDTRNFTAIQDTLAKLTPEKQ
jgi:hypothetical protein